MKLRLFTSYKNVNLSVPEVVLGNNFTTPPYLKTRTQERRAREKAEDEVNIEAVVTSTMTAVAASYDCGP